MTPLGYAFLCFSLLAALFLSLLNRLSLLRQAIRQAKTDIEQIDAKKEGLNKDEISESKDLECQMAARRRYLSQISTEYNAALQKFPTRLVAICCRFNPAKMDDNMKNDV